MVGVNEDAFESRFWYLAQLKPGGFVRAVANLHRQDFSTFMPVREASIRRNGRVRPARQPLFPGYLFTQVLPDHQNWRAINSTYGVARLVSLDRGRPTPVPPAFMEELHRRTDAQGVLGAPEDLKPGDTVRIISGPFAQQIAQIEAAETKDRVILLMQLMGRVVRTQTSARQLEVI
jgi:transcriptional antiterminator RfaH